MTPSTATPGSCDPTETCVACPPSQDDDTVAPGAGFDTHPHRDMEIVTWVLDGSLVHQDSIGNSGVIYPGLAQRMSAGTGILHSEKNDAWRHGVGERHESPVHFVQMWVVPDESGIDPGYEQVELDSSHLSGRLAVVASGMEQHRDRTAIRIRNRFAALHVARLSPGESVVVPDAPFSHVFIPRGEVDMEVAGALTAGDAVRLTGQGGHRITALSSSEIMIWEMHAAIQDA
ncbi:MAG: pirin family protein [Actinobacteria bacterium]|nr:pirin family protein [Actinomycetota bacterium]